MTLNAAGWFLRTLRHCPEQVVPGGSWVHSGAERTLTTRNSGAVQPHLMPGGLSAVLVERILSDTVKGAVMEGLRRMRTNACVLRLQCSS